jgi:Zn-dependent protease
MTMTRPPRMTSAGPGRQAGRDRTSGGIRIAGFTIRFTAGCYFLLLLVVLTGAIGLPASAPGWPVLAYLGVTAGLVAGFLASLVAHELAHALTARRYGSAADEIAIGFAGGAGHGREEFATPRALGRVAVAGPAASLAVAAVSAGAALGLSALGAGILPVLMFTALAWANGLLAVVTALPGAGLDGGRVAQAIAWARTGDRARGTVTSARIGQFTGALLIAGGVALLALGYLAGIPAGLIGLMMAGASRGQAREVRAITALADLRVSDILPPAGPGEPAGSTAEAVPGWQTVQAFLGQSGLAAGTGPVFGPGTGQAAFPVRDFDGHPAGLLTLSQLALVPAAQREAVRLSDVATPLADVVTTTPDEPLSQLLARITVRPRTPAALHTSGYALVIGADGGPAGVLGPADFSRASQLAVLRGRRPGP